MSILKMFYLEAADNLQKEADKCCSSCLNNAKQTTIYTTYGETLYKEGFKKALDIVLKDETGDIDFIKYKLNSILKD